MSMNIVVNRVPFEGMTEEFVCDPATLDIGRADIQPQDPLTVSAFSTRAERELVVRAKIRCQARLECGRCLQMFEQPLQTSTILSYEVQPTDVIDITEDVRQELILVYPMSPVCHEGCRGLCLVCGQNLNVARCEHDQTR